MKNNRLAILVVAMQALGGCSMTPERYVAEPTKSEALNVVDASGINISHNLKDVDRAKLEQQLGKDWSGYKDAAYALNSIVHGDWLWGIGSLFMPSPYRPETVVQPVYWIPVSEARDESEARMMIMEYAERASQFLVRKAQEAGYEVTEKKDILSKDGKEWQKTHYLSGGTCREYPDIDRRNPCVIVVVISMEETGIHKVLCPSFVGEGECWTQELAKKTLGLGKAWKAKWRKMAIGEEIEYMEEPPAFDAYLELSREMPDWFYIYLPPTGEVSMGRGKGFLKYPVVLNKGRVLYFIKPDRG